MLQDDDSVALVPVSFTTQVLPPLAGLGLSHCRLLNRVPPSQDAEQVDQDFQAPQPPSKTVNMTFRSTFLHCCTEGHCIAQQYLQTNERRCREGEPTGRHSTVAQYCLFNPIHILRDFSVDVINTNLEKKQSVKFLGLLSTCPQLVQPP